MLKITAGQFITGFTDAPNVVGFTVFGMLDNGSGQLTDGILAQGLVPNAIPKDTAGNVTGLLTVPTGFTMTLFNMTIGNSDTASHKVTMFLNGGDPTHYQGALTIPPGGAAILEQFGTWQILTP